MSKTFLVEVDKFRNSYKAKLETVSSGVFEMIGDFETPKLYVSPADRYVVIVQNSDVDRFRKVLSGMKHIESVFQLPHVDRWDLEQYYQDMDELKQEG